jgi:hypothetical protein
MLFTAAVAKYEYEIVAKEKNAQAQSHEASSAASPLCSAEQTGREEIGPILVARAIVLCCPLRFINE